MLKPGGKLISISGPPDLAFAKENGLNWPLQQVMRLLSRGIRSKARRRGVDYSFVFMRADGGQLGKLTELIESRVVKPVVDRIFPFLALNEAMSYQETGRARGKIVVQLK